MKQSERCTALLCGLCLIAPVFADDADTAFSWSAGVDISRGDYGGDVDIEELRVPLILRVDRQRIGFGLVIPYLSVKGPPVTAATDPDGDPVLETGDRVTESGLGDVVASLTIYDVFYSQDLDLAFDLTGTVKLGTADEDKDLGTGETDFTLIADLVKFFDQFMLIGSAGYKFRGDPEDVDLNDTVMASVGGVFELSDRTRAGLFFDYREASLADEDAIEELTFSLSRQLTENYALQVFVYKGFTDSTVDWGAGFLVQVL